MYNNQTGRSMVEMLGVLAIIGILSAGGLGMLGKARQNQEMSTLMAEINNVAATAKKMACDYDADYGSYTLYLYKNKAYPDSLKYDDVKNQFSGTKDAVYQIKGDLSYFHVDLSNLDYESCIKVATTEWGNRGANGFIGLAIEKDDIGNYFKCSGVCSGKENATDSASATYPLPVDMAVKYCKNAQNTVQFWYKACR